MNVSNEYRVVDADSRLQLSREVMELMLTGWQPQGGVAYDSNGHKYLQAMTRYVEGKL